MTDRLREGIVRVVGDDGATCGAGFIAAAGLVVTCAHVVVDAGSGPGREIALVRHADGARWRGTVVEEWWGEPDAEDVAVLRVPEAPAEAALLLGALDTAADRQLRTFGFPAAKPVEGLSGRCLVVPGSTTENGHPVHVLESDQVTFGFSGAPVWDDEHEVAVGMVTSIIGVRHVVAGAGDRGRFAVPADPGIRLTRTAFMGPVTTIRARCPELGLPEDVPYLGLDAFEDPRFYFGRDDAVRRLTRTLARERRAVLVGNSGSGKSSLLHAGLDKALTGTSGDLGRRLRCDMVAGTDPLPALVRSLAAGRPASEPRDGRTPGAVTAEGRAALARLAAAFGPGCPPDPGPPQEPRPLPPETVPERLSGMPPGEAAAALSRAVPAGLLLLVDQFERLYAATDERTADHFTDVLLALRDHGTVVVIALRADFYGRALRHAGLADALTRRQVTVLPMTAEELRQAIVEPARLQLRRVQRELADRLIADVRGRPGALPLLELTLKQLWKTEADTGVLSLDGYLALGSGGAAGPGGADGPAEVNPAQGVAGAVYRAAEETWRDKLTDEERDAAPAVFVRLVAAEQIGDASASALTARRAWLGEWDPVARSVVATFVRERLLVLRGDPVSGRPAVEIAHEALIEAWPRLTDWVRYHRAFSDWYAADFAPAFQLWTGHDRREEFLLPKSTTDAARAWCVQRPALMAGPALEYVRASAERLDRAQEEAWHARRNADESRSILWATRAVRHDEPTTALALALNRPHGWNTRRGTALRALAEVAYRPGLRERAAPWPHRPQTWPSPSAPGSS
ncbi:serine protease, partial [Streptomyces sp. C]|uniref:S1 family peptidase n=1 Tax=Streptomyces sp. C TaxID=253839 RepID=UPI0001B4DCA6